MVSRSAVRGRRNSNDEKQRSAERAFFQTGAAHCLAGATAMMLEELLDTASRVRNLLFRAFNCILWPFAPGEFLVHSPVAKFSQEKTGNDGMAIARTARAASPKNSR